MIIQVQIQISHNGYRANYTINSIDSIFFQAELDAFSGQGVENLPEEINFVHDNNRTIASSDVISIAKDLLKEMSSSNNVHGYSLIEK